MKKVNYKELCETYEKIIDEKNSKLDSSHKIINSVTTDWMKEVRRNMDMKLESMDLEEELTKVKREKLYYGLTAIIFIAYFIITF